MGGLIEGPKCLILIKLDAAYPVRDAKTRSISVGLPMQCAVHGGVLCNMLVFFCMIMFEANTII